MTKTYAELKIIVDNCGGQNKNKIVVWLLVWLVDKDLFSTNSFDFSSEGSQKHAAGRLFNLLKMKYIVI